MEQGQANRHRDSLQTQFASASRSRVALLKRQIQTLSQGNKTCSAYLDEAKAIADQLATVGKPMDDQDLISHLLGGLKVSYTPFITSYTLSTRNVDLTLEDFQAELFSFETLLENQQQTSADPHYAFAAHKSKMPPFHKKPQRSSQAPHYRPNRPSATPPTRAYDNGNSTPFVQQNTRHSGRPACQICGKTNHIALDCYERFNYAYQGRIPPPDLAAMAAETNAQFDNQVWYADSGANAHITTNAENLTTQQPFEGSDMITVGNGTANRDDPPVSSNATLTLTMAGKLMQRTSRGPEKTIVKTLEIASFASMVDSGNFVLFNNRSDIIWSSFDFHTDTILGGQNLYSGSELFSSVSKTNHSSGRSRLKMQSDGNLVLYPINTIDQFVDAYWASYTVSKE
ncbi:hypothetical protein Patl1_27807 [Pistacia atlantica]|uniref:Uncharacterized protein n=1 Tax=Pistacia atlantica TaxID=434234 RepID=A0ACC1BEC5_9ROSI|nr:hypothetical protein Patl1_27807 [Pistacia atlantica]